MPITRFPALEGRGFDAPRNALAAQSIQDSRNRNALAGRRLDIAERGVGLQEKGLAQSGRALDLQEQKFTSEQERERNLKIAREAAGVTAAFLSAPREQQISTYPQMRQLAEGFGVELPEQLNDQALFTMRQAVNRAAESSDFQTQAFSESDVLSPEAEAQKIRLARAGQAPAKAQTDAGKSVQDRALFVSQFGEDSPQVAAFDDLSSAESQPEVKLTDVAGLRKEFTAQSKDFVKVRDAFSKVKSLGEQSTAAGDLGMIFNIMKMFDPGSVVRESEFATAENAAGVPQRVRNIYNKLLTGERLAPEQRQDFINTADTVFATQSSAQRRLETSFREIAERQNMNPDNVVIEFGAEAEIGAAQAPSPSLEGLSDNDLLTLEVTPENADAVMEEMTRRGF